MKQYQASFSQRQIVLVVQAACVAMLPVPAAYADEDSAVAELTQPAREVTAGVIGVNNDSYKFGDFNGLNQSGIYFDLGFKAGSKTDENSAWRWRTEGIALGTDAREIRASGGLQGIFNLNLDYNRIPHYLTDSYGTIYRGVNSNTLTLPSNYPATRTTTNGGNSTQSALLSNVIQQDFITSNIGFTRTQIRGGGSYIFAPGWEAKVTASEDRKDGTKLTGYAFSSSSYAAMLPEPVHHATDGINLSLAYTGEKSTTRLAFDYSTFRNDIASWTAQNPFVNSPSGSAGTIYNNTALLLAPPNNQARTFSLDGNYRFTPKSQVSYALSSGVMTQNDAFHCETSNAGSCVSGVNGWSIPASSANARIDTSSAYIKLTSRPYDALNLGAFYRYDNRDNKTPINTFIVNFADASGTATSSVTNDPLNIRKYVAGVNADYAFMRGQAFKLGYQQEDIRRTTNGSGLAPSRSVNTANTAVFTAPAGQTSEKTWNIEYRNSMLDDLTWRTSYAFSDRAGSDYNFPVFAATTNVSAQSTNAFYQNFVDSYVADRKRDKVRAAVDYQLSDKWFFGVSADYTRDQYGQSYSLQSVNNSAINLDVGYTPSDNFSISTYYTHENQSTKAGGKYVATTSTKGATLNGVALANPLGGACNASGQPCILGISNWQINNADHVDTIGITAKFRELLHGKLDLTADLSYSYDRTPITAAGNGVYAVDSGVNYILFPAQGFPDITSRVIALKLTGSYKIDKSQTVRMVYMYQHLSSNDWQYNAYASPIAMTGYLSPGMTSPQYNIHALGVAYVHTFR